MMCLILLCCAAFFSMTAANPVVRDTDSLSKGAPWEFFHPRDNEPAEEFHKTMSESVNMPMRKRMMRNSGTGGSVEDGDMEQLRARLQTQLAELRARLRAYIDPHFRLWALTRQLQGSLRASAQELCGSLPWDTKGPEVPGDLSSSQEAVHSVERVVDNTQRVMASQLEDFQIHVSRALGPAQQSLSTLMGQEVEAFWVGFQGKVTTLHSSLAQDSRQRNNISASLAQFCHSTMSQIRDLGIVLEQHLEGFQQDWHQVPSLQPHASISVLRDELSNKLTILLRDIQQALD